MSSQHEVRLLLVDDDPSAIQVMSRMLEQYPDQRFATCGADALRLAREATPDLILLDADMPGMTGFDVCDSLKADPVLARVPVIFVTSHDTPELEVAALRNGAADFITKPLVTAQLTARVRAHLRARLLVDELMRDCLAAGSAAPRTSVQTPRLLIVDDDVASIQILRHTLATMGDFHFAKSGEEALELARRLVPDLILLDAHMPGLDGFEVCRVLKSEAPFRHVPIAFVTRFSDPRNEMQALDLGAADFIAKPYTPAVLRARVRNLLDLKRRADADVELVRGHWRRMGDARAADIVGAAAHAIVSCNVDDVVVLINAAACRMFGVDQEQAIGARVQAFLGEEGGTEDRWRSGESDFTLTQADGASCRVEVSVSRVGEGVDRLTTFMLREISNGEEREAELRPPTQAEVATHLKPAMTPGIALEITKSLNTLQGLAQVMEADSDHLLPAPQAGRLARIVATVRYLEEIMRDATSAPALVKPSGGVR